MGHRIYGIIGHPVAHSLSPAMQNAAFKACDIDAEYLTYDVEPEDLERFLAGLIPPRGGITISGLNVTIPHKIKTKVYLERHGSIDDNARRLGAVNTIKILDDGTLCGYNTDGPGFYRSLVEDLRFEPEGRNVFVLGAGGAARAIIMYLGKGPSKIYVADVDSKKTGELAGHYAKFYDSKRLEVVEGEAFKKALGESELFINATPVGLKKDDPSPVDASLLPQGIRVYDLVYNRPRTALVKEANSKKLHAITGVGMLLYQGAIAFEIWTGVKAPVEVMRKALRKALHG